MARVTKINVGGTNYDIAHEGELKNSGFEVVTSLPTTNLFEGREVMYQGEKYIYYNGWNRETNPIKKNAIFRAKENGEFNQFWNMLQYGLLLSNNENCVKKEDRLIELIDNETGDISTYIGYFPQLYVGKTLRWTAFNPDRDGSLVDRTYSNFNSVCQPFSVSIKGNKRNSNCLYTVEYYKYTNATGDGDTNNQANFEWVTVFSKEMYFSTTFISIPNSFFIANSIGSYYIRNIRVSITPITNDPNDNIYVSDIDVFYFTSQHQSLLNANRLINYDAAIEPTQTGVKFKTLPWWMQYLTQGVNWLKANNVRLSAYNTKVAALEQADNTKLDKRSYNQVYTNCGYTNIVSSTTGALIIELPFAPNGDSNNSMTYIELNVYSHKKGCSKYIIGVYSYTGSSEYEWSAYSYMGYNYFSKISFGRRTDNNNIVVVLGDFTDVHQYEHFSISNIITGFNRNNDDTDGFLLYTDSDSNNYSILKQSTYNPLNISYNDLTNTPNLATVATSGSYNDLIDKPTFSGSYNDLTDKPTLFSGSYDDLTDKPTLATVATSGSYNDLTDKPTFSGSYNDLTDKPTLAAVATSGDYNDLLNRPAFSGSYNDLTDKPTLAAVATSGDYNDLLNRPAFSGSYNDLSDKPTLATVATSGSYNDLTDTPTIPSSFADLNGNIDAANQIGDLSIANSKLANSSMTLNGITVNLGDTATLPCFISYSGTLFQARIENNWLQIYRNGIWANLYYLSSNPPTECRYITDLSDPSWYDESVTEYELDNSATTQLLSANGSTNLANWIEEIGAQQITFNSSVPSKRFNKKGALDNIISNLKGKGYSVFVENDIDTILTSGNDWVMSIKIKRFNNLYKAIIECYVAR